MADRIPYVGEGADGARRSARIDREEIDCLDREWDAPRIEDLEESAASWERQAERLADHALPPRQGCECGSKRPHVYSRPRLAYVCPDCGGYR